MGLYRTMVIIFMDSLLTLRMHGPLASISLKMGLYLLHFGLLQRTRLMKIMSTI